MVGDIFDDIPDTGDPIADIRAAIERIAAAAPQPRYAYIEMRPEIYIAAVEAIRRGIRHAFRTLRRPLPLRHRPTYARLAARRARAAEYLVNLPHLSVRPADDPLVWRRPAALPSEPLPQ